MRTIYKARVLLALAVVGLIAASGGASAQGNLGYWTSRLFTAGSGTATYTPSGTIEINTTQVGTGANTTETDLWSYSLPANTLNADGRTLRVTVSGDNAANANAKTVRFYFGATSVFISNAATTNPASWAATYLITRTGASAQLLLRAVSIYGAGAVVANPVTSTPAEVSSGAIVMKITGQNGIAAANDIVFKGALVEVVK